MLASWVHTPGLAGSHSSAASGALLLGVLLKPDVLLPPQVEIVGQWHVKSKRRDRPEGKDHERDPVDGTHGRWAR